MIPLSDGIPARRFPYVTVALILANVAVWVVNTAAETISAFSVESSSENSGWSDVRARWTAALPPPPLTAAKSPDAWIGAPERSFTLFVITSAYAVCSSSVNPG